MESKKVKILAIDDIQDNLISLKALLSESLPDAIILTALNGAKGIEIARAENPNVILLDILMPEMDGYEVCKSLKSQEPTKHIPIVMITAIKTDAESRIKGLNLGADAFLSKPIDPSELAAQVKVMLRIRDAEDKLRQEKENLEELVEERTHDLNKSNELNKSITESAANAIITINSDGLIFSWNKAAEETFGYTSSEMTNKQVSSIIPEDYNKDLDELKKNGAKKIIGKTIEITALRKDGTEFPIDLSLSEWQADNQKYYTSIIRDISKRKQAEEAMKKSEINFKALFENSPDIVALTSMEGTFIDINRVATGYKKDQVIGTKVTDFLSPEQTNEFKNAVERCIKTGESQSYMPVIANPEGQQIYYHNRVSHFKYGKTKNQLVINFTDITERKQAEEEIRKQLDELQRWNDVTLGREGRVMELKHEVNELLKQRGEPLRYNSTNADEG